MKFICPHEEEGQSSHEVRLIFVRDPDATEDWIAVAQYKEAYGYYRWFSQTHSLTYGNETEIFCDGQYTHPAIETRLYRMDREGIYLTDEAKMEMIL